MIREVERDEFDADTLSEPGVFEAVDAALAAAKITPEQRQRLISCRRVALLDSAAIDDLAKLAGGDPDRMAAALEAMGSAVQIFLQV